jgi:regulator of cell morphogenesis and NO signaling
MGVFLTDQLPDCTIAEIALDFPQSIKILNRYDLDYCCQGNKLFRHVCEEHHLSPSNVWEEIIHELPIPSGNLTHRFECWDIPLLIDFIVQNHHEYIRLAIPQISNLLHKMKVNHEHQHPELTDIETHFGIFAEKLLEHLPKEEEIVFPAIRRLATSPVSVTTTLATNLQESISVLQHEHAYAGEILKLLRSLTRHYIPPTNSCPTFHLVYKLLEEFDQDLIQHFHLENNILFSKAKI